MWSPPGCASLVILRAQRAWDQAELEAEIPFGGRAHHGLVRERGRRQGRPQAHAGPVRRACPVLAGALLEDCFKPRPARQDRAFMS